MAEIKIGIIVADDDEYKPLAEKIEQLEFEHYSFLGRRGHKFKVKSGERQATVYSLICGIGKVNAAAAAAHFADKQCNIILNYGLSGGISGVIRGELILNTKFLEHDFDLSPIGYKLCEKPGQEYIYYSDETLKKLFMKILPDVKSGTAVSGDRFICDEQSRRSLKENFGAKSCDMETAAIAYVCNFSEIPFISLRRISDDAGNDAVDSYRAMNLSGEAVLSDLVFKFIEEILNSGFVGKRYES
ncbi:MAG: 5'-methylthioadenosine/S-adenosylhomocysteine nucleosidase [Acutalibacteraceae bacterium]|jgi:adenosylhomocysteine nucleosidase